MKEQETNDMPYNFWDYCINPILGYRYYGDFRKMRPVKEKDDSTTTK